ncbi:MAG: DUF2218 domain-containing protein [Magnetospirillum gryphiswaldense]|nr:DUF2218 domain-containing protein [Magnetospirillum gryphiswaldense]
MTLSARAAITTAAASRYLGQLCKHFAHKIPVQYDDQSGRADFPWGTCLLAARDGVLRLDLTAEDETSLSRVKAVVEDHLVRFAWRESITFAWEPQA